MESGPVLEPSRSAPGLPQTRDQRSAVTNGKRLHVEPPPKGGTAWARRFRDILAEILSDLGGNLSEAQRQLARRCATICIACEKLEGEAAAGNAIDLELYGTLTDRFGRAAQRLGLQRQMRDVTPTLDDIAEEIAAEHEAEAVP